MVLCIRPGNKLACRATPSALASQARGRELACLCSHCPALRCEENFSALARPRRAARCRVSLEAYLIRPKRI